MFTSLVDAFLEQNPHLRVQTYFKASLTALSHAMEDWALAAGTPEPALVVANFQQERFYRQEAGRYKRLSQQHRVYILCAQETGFVADDPERRCYPKIARGLLPFAPNDPLARRVASSDFEPQSCQLLNLPRASRSDRHRRVLIRREPLKESGASDRAISTSAAHLLLERVAAYRPDLAAELELARQEYCEGESLTAIGACSELQQPPQSPSSSAWSPICKPVSIPPSACLSLAGSAKEMHGSACWPRQQRRSATPSIPSKCCRPPPSSLVAHSKGRSRNWISLSRR